MTEGQRNTTLMEVRIMKPIFLWVTQNLKKYESKDVCRCVQHSRPLLEKEAFRFLFYVNESECFACVYV